MRVSPSLLPRPSDWPESTVLTGQWHDPDPGPAAGDPELDRFLADGDVVYVGFGSMASGDPVAFSGAPSRDAVRPVAERVRAEDGCGAALEVLRSLR